MLITLRAERVNVASVLHYKLCEGTGKNVRHHMMTIISESSSIHFNITGGKNVLRYTMTASHNASLLQNAAEPGLFIFGFHCSSLLQKSNGYSTNHNATNIIRRAMT